MMKHLYTWHLPKHHLSMLMLD